jgi:hypothetical protein
VKGKGYGRQPDFQQKIPHPCYRIAASNQRGTDKIPAGYRREKEECIIFFLDSKYNPKNKHPYEQLKKRIQKEP